MFKRLLQQAVRAALSTRVDQRSAMRIALRYALTNFIYIGPLLVFLLTGSAVVAEEHSTRDPSALLREADRARGGGLSGLYWVVQVKTTGIDDVQDMTLQVKAARTSSVAETLEPLRSKGAKMLQVDRAMWLTKPGLKKPIPISPRQRLSGQAAIGDVAATNYSLEYAATVLRNDVVDEEPCIVLDLKAIDQHATYDRVVYWVSASRGTALRAEFFSLSGKRLKVAEFRYENVLKHDGRSIPFISSMLITDDLTKVRTTLRYSDIRIRRIPASEFDVGQLD